MKKITLVISVLLMLMVVTGCGRKKAQLNPGVSENIAVLTMNGALKDQTEDQVRALDNVIRWMDRDIIKNLKRSGFNAVLLNDKKDYNSAMGKLLVIDVDAFDYGSAAARAFVGFGAGASSLDLDYKLYSENGQLAHQWKDGVGSSKGPNYCAQSLDRNATTKLIEFLNM